MLHLLGLQSTALLEKRPGPEPLVGTPLRAPDHGMGNAALLVEVGAATLGGVVAIIPGGVALYAHTQPGGMLCLVMIVLGACRMRRLGGRVGGRQGPEWGILARVDTAEYAKPHAAPCWRWRRA